MRRDLAFLGGLAILSGAAAVQPPTLDIVLNRAEEYVRQYKRDFVGIVAEELYRQEVLHPPGHVSMGPRPSDERRDLKSDILFVRTPDADHWLQFRDVFEVDGKPVRDRTDRLTRLFLQPAPGVQQQIEAIISESARYNIGNITRNFNIPVLALTVLEAPNHGGFAFSGSGRRGDDRVWIIEFREVRSDTLIRSGSNEPMPAHGTLMVEAATGRVLSTELAVDSRSVTAHIEVTYAVDPSLSLAAPREMREEYGGKDGTTIKGRATYSRFRRFQVQVDEKVKK